VTMAQVLPPFCPNCGTPTVPGQRFCANCGRPFVSAPPQGANVPVSNPRPSTPFPPTSQPVPQNPAQAAQPWRNTGPTAPALSPPSYTPAPKKRTLGGKGCVLICLLLLILLGVGSYLGAAAFGIHLPGFGSGNASQSPVTTTQINTTVAYAGVELTILSAQQSQSFNDDPNTTSTGMVRLSIQEQNTTTVKVSWLYANTARLLLPGKSTAAPTFVRANVGIAPGATQKSTVDFAVPVDDKVSQLILRLGAANEAQMDIPLTSHADLGKYSPKTIQPNGQMIYMGLNWTLTKATEQLSIAGQQASKGMTYVIVTLQVVNTLSQQAITGSPFDYARLRAGNTTATPKLTDLPVSFDTGEKGKTGTITFLVPGGNTTLTLIFLPQSGADQATTDFQFA
jgi:hypothetical protein